MQDGRTPLSLAAAEEKSEVVDVLLQHGANPNHSDEGSRPPLLLAARSLFRKAESTESEFQEVPSIVPRVAESIITLLKYGANVNMRSEIVLDAPYDFHEEETPTRQESPMETAIAHCLLPIVKMLWEAGADCPENITWFKNAGPKYSRADVEKYINNDMSKPHTLQTLVRKAIRESLGQSVSKVNQLDIPQFAKDILLFDDLRKYKWELVEDWPDLMKNYQKQLNEGQTRKAGEDTTYDGENWDYEESLDWDDEMYEYIVNPRNKGGWVPWDEEWIDDSCTCPLCPYDSKYDW